jgi:DNA-directed RNA polymerase subunit RPC12/RpoP
MSEFKYACPVCGQHMMCDSSQSGSVMECPTCFQKIVAPLAPADADSKFILTGTKFTEKKIPTTLANAAASGRITPEKTFPIGTVIALLLLMMLLASAFLFREKIFKPSASGAQTNEMVSAPGETKGPANTKKPEKPPVVAPAASDTNWMLALGTNPIPDAPVAGRIHGQDFIVERAYFSTNGILTIRTGTRGPVEFGLTVNFSGAQAASLSGQTINVIADADKAARVQLRWKNAGSEAQKAEFTNGYAMRLEFGALTNYKLPGKIYLCTPDAEKSYLLGTFHASVPKPKAPKK